MTQKGDGPYAPASNAISVKEALARGDAAQAKQLREWAEDIDAAVAAGDIVRVMATTNAMKNTAFIVERFTSELLEKMGVKDA